MGARVGQRLADLQPGRAVRDRKGPMVDRTRTLARPLGLRQHFEVDHIRAVAAPDRQAGERPCRSASS